MDLFVKNFGDIFELITGMGPDLYIHLITSVALIVFIYSIRLFFVHLLWKKTYDPIIRYRWKKASAYIAFFIGILLVGRVWFSGVTAMIAALGFISAGLAIALQDLIRSMAGWLYILWRKPFRVGDRIEINNIAGDVIDIRLFKFTLLEIGNWVDADQSTGRMVHLPNSLILIAQIYNYTAGFEFIWDEIPVVITFESNWKKAKKILEEVVQNRATDLTHEGAGEQVRKASREFMIYYRSLTPIVYTSVVDIGVSLTLRYIVVPRKRRGVRQQIWEDILNRFARIKDIDFAYPTIRYYDNKQEGKVK